MTNEEFSTQIKQLSKRIDNSKDSIQTEEATKMSFIVPLFQILGFDVFNPTEFVPEFTADVGIKKGEKVDYAILVNNQPTILIEAKWCGEKLERHDSQLFRYFATSKAKFAILTNGLFYRFFTDLDEKNKMDEKPFLEINMLDPKESHIIELRKFCKEKFDVTTIFNSASELKYTTIVKQNIISEFSNPSDQLVRLLIADVYDGVKTQKVVEDFKSIVKKSYNQHINELISERLKNALDTERETRDSTQAKEVAPDDIVEETDKIITTEEELQAFFIVQSILAETVDLEKITYKDTESYLSVLYDNNTRKWICRIKLGEKIKKLIVPAENNKTTSFLLNKLTDIYIYKETLIELAKKHASQ